MKTNKTVNRDNATIKPKTNMKTPKTEPASNTSVYDPGEINHPPTVSMNAPSASRPTTVVAANDSKSIVLTPSVPLHETVAQALPSETITGHPGKTGNGAKISSKPSKLTKAQRKAEARCAATIRQYRAGKAKDFHNLVAACYEVQRDELYCDYPTQAAYFKAEFDLSRSASLRLAQMGKILDRLSPIGDIAALLPADSHVRPLLTLTEEQQDAVLTKVSGWKKVANLLTTPSKLILAARTFLYPPSGPRDKRIPPRPRWRRNSLELSKTRSPSYPAMWAPKLCRCLKNCSRRSRTLAPRFSDQRVSLGLKKPGIHYMDAPGRAAVATTVTLRGRRPRDWPTYILGWQ